MSRSHEDIVASIPDAAFANKGVFAPKLTFQERCEVLALYRRGIARSIIAEAYNIDRRTVTHIQNPKSPHYKAVRKELARLGHEEFGKQYITESAASRISKTALAEVRSRKEVKLDQNKKAAGHKGVNLVMNENCSIEHRIMIDWIEGDDAVHGPGWYYQDLDGPVPDAWLNNGPESTKTSQACLRAVQENLSD